MLRISLVTRISLVIGLALAVVLLLACGEDLPEPTRPATIAPAPQTITPTENVRTTESPQPTAESVVEELRSEKRRSSASVGQDLDDLAQDNGEFALDLYQALMGGDGNLFFSPFSISQALAMPFAGARGETERQMADTLRYRQPQDRLHPAFNALDRTLASRGEDLPSMGPPGAPKPEFRLNIANAVWGQAGFSFLEDYLDTLAENYGAGLRPMDFAMEPEESRVRINDWVADQTEDKIKDLLQQGTVNDTTRLVLTNAIYFNASWLWPFNPGDTVEQPFNLLDGRTVEVPMMNETNDKFYGYAKGDGFQVVDLPYFPDDLAFTILLPDDGKFRDFERSLTPALLGQAIDELETAYITLTMPRFEFESAFSLNETLAGMGMPNAFGDADFSGITGSKDLWISEAVHKAFVSVDETGTEAAAATSVAMPESGPITEPVPVTIDRPFIFLIRDKPTGTILFLGRVMDPE